MLEGRVIPVLGAGVNVCERPKSFPGWKPGSNYLPNGSELAKHLADQSAYEPNLFKRVVNEEGHVTGYDRVYDLVSVSQYVEVAKGSLPLHRALHDVFAREYPPSVVHRFLAQLAKVVAVERPLLMLTTNYDDALERALQRADVAYDVITYVSDYPQSKRGHFVHSFWESGATSESKPTRIRSTKTYTDVLLKRPAVVKIHGAVRRHGSVEEDNYVITEDDYIDFLVHQNATRLLPVTVAERLPGSHFLFLGYSLKDWNLRVLLRRIWHHQSRGAKSWSVRLDADELEAQYVTTLRYRLPEYVSALRQACLEELLDAFRDPGDARRNTLEATQLEALLKPLSERDEDNWDAMVRGLSGEQFEALLEALPTLRGAHTTTLPQALVDEIRRRIGKQPPPPPNE